MSDECGVKLPFRPKVYRVERWWSCYATRYLSGVFELGEPGFDPYGNSGGLIPRGSGAITLENRLTGHGLAARTTAPKDPPSGSIPNRLFGSNSSTRFSDLLRFAETPRLQYVWIPDSRGAQDLAQQEIDFSVVFAFPNFLNTERPIYVAPSFGLNLLQGAGSVGLPNQVYSGVLELQWQTDPHERFNVDLGLGIGVHSDFKSL